MANASEGSDTVRVGFQLAVLFPLIVVGPTTFAATPFREVAVAAGMVTVPVVAMVPAL